MPADALQCGHCERDDFEEPDELIEHVREEHTQLLYYAANAGNSGDDRAIHVDRDCIYLQRANDIHDCRLDRTPRGSLCDNCGPDDVTLDALQADAQRAIADGGDEP